MADDGADLGELFDRVLDLAVEEDAVGDDDDRVEQRAALLLDADQLVGQPGDRVGLAAAGRVLDEVAFADAGGGDVGQQLAHDVELVVARPDLAVAFLAALSALEFDALGVVFDDVGEAVAGERLFPEVVGLEPVGVGRVAGAVVPAAVEGQEPGGFALQVGAEADLVIVDGEVGEAAALGEEGLARVAVAAVLLDGVLDGLFGEAVFELEGGGGQAVDEEAEVERELAVVVAVAQLAGDGEAVVAVAELRLLVAGRGRAVEEVDVGVEMFDAVAQDVDGAAFVDLALAGGRGICSAWGCPRCARV